MVLRAHAAKLTSQLALEPGFRILKLFDWGLGFNDWCLMVFRARALCSLTRCPLECNTLTPGSSVALSSGCTLALARLLWHETCGGLALWTSQVAYLRI